MVVYTRQIFMIQYRKIKNVQIVTYMEYYNLTYFKRKKKYCTKQPAFK